MATIHPKILERLRTIEAAGNDHREASDQDLRVLWWLHTYMWNECSQFSMELRGWSFRPEQETCRLTVRVRMEGIPRVAFTTGRTPTDCAVIFCRKFYNDTVQWYDDKYG